MGQQKTDGAVGEQIACDAAEGPFLQPGVAIGPRDDESGVPGPGFVENLSAGGLRSRERDDRFGGDLVPREAFDHVGEFSVGSRSP